MKNTKNKFLFKKILEVKNLQKYVKITFFIPEHLGLSVVKTRRINNHRFSSETISSLFCLCYYIYAIIMQLLAFIYSNSSNDSLEDVINLVLLLSGFLLIFAYNFNKYYFSTHTTFLYKKMMNVENNLNSVGIITITKKQTMFINICLTTIFIGFVICFIFDYISFYISFDGNDTPFGEYIAYSLQFFCIVAYCSCSTITFYILKSLYRATNIIIIEHFQKLKQNQKINHKLVRQIKYLLNIENDICECRNLFLYVTAIVNIINLLSVMVITVSYAYWIFYYSIKSATLQDQLMKQSIINFVIYVQFVLYIMIYVAQQFKFEVIIIYIIK